MQGADKIAGNLPESPRRPPAIGDHLFEPPQCMFLARLFQRPHYRSEITAFIDELKRARPELVREQREGRALLWDRPIDPELQAQFAEGRVAQQPYVYQTKPTL